MFKPVNYKSGKRDVRDPITWSLERLCDECFDSISYVEELTERTEQALDFYDENERQSILRENLGKLHAAKKYLEIEDAKRPLEYRHISISEVLERAETDLGLAEILDGGEIEEASERIGVYDAVKESSYAKYLKRLLTIQKAASGGSKLNQVNKIYKQLKQLAKRLKASSNRLILPIRYLINTFARILDKQKSYTAHHKKPLLRPPIERTPQIQPTAPNFTA
jgi:regulator of sigma D